VGVEEVVGVEGETVGTLFVAPEIIVRRPGDAVSPGVLGEAADEDEAIPPLAIPPLAVDKPPPPPPELAVDSAPDADLAARCNSSRMRIVSVVRTGSSGGRRVAGTDGGGTCLPDVDPLAALPPPAPAAPAAPAAAVFSARCLALETGMREGRDWDADEGGLLSPPALSRPSATSVSTTTRNADGDLGGAAGGAEGGEEDGVIEVASAEVVSGAEVDAGVGADVGTDDPADVSTPDPPVVSAMSDSRVLGGVD
jgi:hypothetical protein